MTDINQQSFEDASQAGQRGLISDLFAFMSENAKWWLIPIVLVLGAFGVLVFFSATGLSPFIYTLF